MFEAMGLLVAVPPGLTGTGGREEEREREREREREESSIPYLA